ncbi:hypothetical protein NMNIID777_11020 [Neisseria meningitidis]|nr:hypothetical protein NMNIID777_11020 [Neisseria meningitidis]
MNFALSVIMLTLASFLPVPPAGAAVFTWKDGGGNSYSDVPKQLHPDQSQILNLRTRQTKPAVKPAQADAGKRTDGAAQENNPDTAEKNRQLEEEKNCRNRTAEQRRKLPDFKNEPEGGGKLKCEKQGRFDSEIQ